VGYRGDMGNHAKAAANEDHHFDHFWVVEGIHAGAVGYMLKDADAEEPVNVVLAIRHQLVE
jgi:DNA-binding NarL/FixJ family response regulator